MAESSFVWDAAGGGDQSPHSEADVAAMFAAMAGGSGVFAGYLNELAPTVSGSNVLINTGWAMVDGHPYRNSASKSTTITTPSINTTGHRIVLRASWSAQTVRITDIASADGTSSIPAATQTSGTTYDVTLATLTITTGGVITLTDAREYVQRITTNVQAFTGSGTWTKPSIANAQSVVEVWAMSGGGGGGGGKGAAGGTDRGGGGGGGGGGFVRKTFRASELGATESVTIGALAAGGAGGSSADGSDGTTGNNTTFGSWVTSYGGAQGTKGTGSLATGGAGGGFYGGGGSSDLSGGGAAAAAGYNSEWGGGGGGTAFAGGAAGNAGNGSLMGSGGGGGGGGLATNNTEWAGGAGGSTSTGTTGGGGTAGTTNGGAGGNGAASSLTFAGGSGGGGGGAQDSGTGGAGGDGARGGGGGGGGGGTSTGGDGGDGGAGYCVVITYY